MSRGLKYTISALSILLFIAFTFSCRSTTNVVSEGNPREAENTMDNTMDNDLEDTMKKYMDIALLSKEEGSYSNPMNIKNIGDPFVLESKGKYYCFATSAHNGFMVWESGNLADWDLLGMAYKRTGSSWSGDSYWAPEVIEYNEKFYMFYTARTLNNPSLRIGLAISDKPEGPYVDYEDKPFYDPGYAVIDASVFIDDDGKKYMYYSIDCSENIINGRHESHIAVVELADDLMGVISDPVVLSKPDQPWELISGNEWAWNEGPIVLKREGKYYMFYSANFFADKAYSVGYSVADNPTGPFIKNKKPLLWYTSPVKGSSVPAVSGPGHNSLALSPDKKELFIVYHTHTKPEKPSGDRQAAIDRIGFRGDGTIYANGPTIAPQPLPSGSKGYTLLVPDHIRASSEKSEVLLDGEIGMSQDMDNGWYDGKEAWVELSWQLAQNISQIAIYPANEKTAERQVFDIIIDDKYIISGIHLENTGNIPGYCELLTFDPIQANTIKLRYAAGEKAALSEIMIFSKTTGLEE